jgi:hypothetical protein
MRIRYLRVVGIIALVAFSWQSFALTYKTTFPATENPISENGNWVNGGALGLDWHDCRTTGGNPGFAFGTQPGTVKFDDSACTLTGSWGPNQTAQGTVHIPASDATQFEEVEVHLRTTIAAHKITGYEINCSVKTNNKYLQIVRWNGALGAFTLLNSTGIGCVDGDILKATISGSTITAYKNGVQVLQATDSTYTNGAPGMGFYIESGSSITNSDFGFSAFNADDGQGGATPAAPSRLSAVVN